MSFNRKIYGDAIKAFIPDIPEEDITWLSNKCANVYRDIDDGCVDAFRVSRVFPGDGWSQDYEETISCCGQINKKVFNPKTNNKYWIGFNFGH